MDKIVGPGNIFVATAKRMVFGAVGIDMIAGPSEILVVCDGKTDPDWIAMDLFSQAETLYHQLLSSTHQRVVLHGDLHHDNILKSTPAWQAIDPKGIVGDPVFEGSAFLRNYLIIQDKPLQVLKKRLEIFSQILGYSAQRICEWGLAQTVLSAVWIWEDQGQGWETTLDCARLFQQLLSNRI